MKRTKASITVILFVALLVGLSAGSQQGDTSGQIVIEVLTEEGFQPLDYSIVGTVVPTIRIGGPLQEGYRVFNDRPDGRAGVDGGPEGLGREITASFEEPAPGVVEGTLAFLYGANDIIITDAAEIPQVLASARMLNYTPQFEDVNGNGRLDISEDANWDGVIDAGEDLNGNELLDLDEDLNGNGRLDTDEDLNDNGILDPGEDRNFNGVLDEDVTLTIFALKGQSELSYTPEGFAYEEGILLLDFVAGATDVEISNYLQNWDLHPIGLSLTAAPSGNYLRLTVRIPPDTPGHVLARQLNGLEPSDLGLFPEEPPPYPLLLATLNLASEPQDWCSETLPQRLITGRGPNAGDNYPQRTCGFDLDGDRVPFDDDHDGRINEDPPGDANGDGAPGILGVDDDWDGFIDEGSVNNDDEDGWIDEDPVNDHAADEVQMFWEHFYMDTFAAHRLVEKLVQPPPHVGVAVVDTGFGNGNDQHLGDVPLARLFGIYNEITHTAFANLRDAHGQSMSDPIGIIDGKKEHGHGTSVALLAAGDGSDYVLGTGKHVDLRPIKTDGTNLADAVKRAATDPRVDVINVSWGPATNCDTNGNGIIEDIRDENGNGVDDDDPLDDTNGDGHLEPPGKGIDNDGNGKIDDDLPGSELSRAINLMHNFRLEFLDAINEAYGHQVIIVFAAGNEGHDGVAYTYPGIFSARTRHGALDDDGDLRFDEDSFPLSPVAYGDPPAVDFFVGVGATGYDGSPDRGEMACAFSNAGPQLSVSAAGEAVSGVTPETPYKPMTVDGTSFAAPLVSGLAGELIVLDRGLHPNQNDQYTAQQIVEFIEATADDLGTKGLLAGPGGNAAPNDAPGNIDDDRFGWGRINCWKAALSVVNGGLAPESLRATSMFESLKKIKEANTKWYGFKIITSVPHATVWINGKKLEDNGASVPDAPAITAYAGVRSDQIIRIGVPAEDPTSGIVPVGNDGGEYIITFSIERKDLIDGITVNSYYIPPTLSLRRPGQTVTDAPFFNLELGAKQLELMRSNPQKIPGVVFDDFVFEVTPADFGDAPFAYPTDYIPYVDGYGKEGARHLNSNLEWLGKPARPQIQSVSPEQLPDSPVDPDGVPNVLVGRNPPYDLDRYDDGVVFYPLTYLPGGKGILDFTVCVADPSSGRYSAAQSKTLFVNAWIDWNTNKSWEENQEHIIDGVEIIPDDPRWVISVDPGDTTIITQIAGSPTTKPGWVTYRAEFDVPPVIGSGELWARFRLDYRQDVGRADDSQFGEPLGLHLTKGPARFGEVEDYLIGTDFGDAPDTGRYPTRMPNGARHLDIYKEWLQDSKTREPDACLTKNAVSADQDGHPNLGDDCDSKDLDLAEEATVSFDQAARELTVNFVVKSTIATRGYDLMPVDPNPFSEKNKIKVSTMDPANCCTQTKSLVWATPPWSGGKGRYHATKVDDDRDGKKDEDPIDGADNENDRLVDEDPPGTKPLFVNIFVDWNGDRVWDTSPSSKEWVLKDGRIAPETFGKDGKYTLGEPFEDKNHDGVHQDGEPFKDSTGTPEQKYECVFFSPEDVAKRFWVRIRLAYAELSDGTIPDSGGIVSEKWVEAGVAHSTEDKRAMDKEKGGALFGEVEDYPVRTISVTKKPDVTEVPPGGEIDYTISFKNPSEIAVEEIRLVDELPDAVSFKSMVKAPSGITYNSETHTVEGTLDLLPLAETEITYITEVPPTIPPYTLIANCVTIETPTFTDKTCSPEVTIAEPEVEPCDTALLVEPVEGMIEVLRTMQAKLEKIAQDLDREKLTGSDLRWEFRKIPYNEFKEVTDSYIEPLELCVPKFSQKLEELNKAASEADSLCSKERKTTCPVRITEKASEPIKLYLMTVIAMILLLNNFLK